MRRSYSNWCSRLGQSFLLGCFLWLLSPQLQRDSYDRVRWSSMSGTYHLEESWLLKMRQWEHEDKRTMVEGKENVFSKRQPFPILHLCNSATVTPFLLLMYSAVQLMVWLVVGPSASIEFIFQSRMVLSESGKAYSPINTQGQLIYIRRTSTLTRCAMSCNRDARCRVFDYQALALEECRLFEGDTVTMGTLVPSPSPKSLVGLVQFTGHLFIQHGLPCTLACFESRYLVCDGVGTCQCVEHTY